MKYTATGNGMPVFAGASYQRGYGLGRVMKNVARMATPILKKAGTQALKSGLSVIAESVMPSRKNVVRKTQRKNVIRKTKIKRRNPIRRSLKSRGVARIPPLNQRGSGKVVKRRVKKLIKRKMKKSSKRKCEKDIFSYK